MRIMGLRIVCIHLFLSHLNFRGRAPLFMLALQQQADDDYYNNDHNNYNNIDRIQNDGHMA